MRTLLPIASLTIALMTSSALAKNDTTALLGSGHLSCGSWTERKSDPVTYGQQEEWLWGFVSAYNWYVADNGDIANGGDGYGMATWMDNYCRDHPMAFVADGANALVFKLKTKGRR